MTAAPRDQTAPRAGDRQAVLDRCQALAASSAEYPFGEDTAVFEVAGTMFALLDRAGPQGTVTLGADPADVVALVTEHPQITPGYSMNERHWIAVDLGSASGDPLPTGLLDELVDDSYDRVMATLPVRLRPAPRSRPSR